MSKIDRVIAYRTMRAVQQANQPAPTAVQERPTRWQRWVAWVNRVTDRLVG